MCARQAQWEHRRRFRIKGSPIRSKSFAVWKTASNLATIRNSLQCTTHPTDRFSGILSFGLDVAFVVSEMDGVTARSVQLDHISQEKLVESLSTMSALTVNQRWHVSGCDRCARLLDVLQRLREVRLRAPLRTFRTRFI